LMKTRPSLDMASAHRFADKVARRDADAAWRTAVDLASRCLADIVIAGARGTDLAARGYGPMEVTCLARLQSLAGPDQWGDAWEKNSVLFAKADSANLDRKQVMLSALAAMENVARTGV
jgi:DNA polymerase-3 subunit delta'